MLLPNSLTLSPFLILHTAAHFVLQSPPSLGFSDSLEATYPCGSFPINDRTNVTPYPLDGYPIHVLSTHTKSTFKYRAALSSDTDSFIDLVPPVSEVGVGDFCLPAVPGPIEWYGKDAVVQVAQFGPDGILYQCAAVTFAKGPAFVPDSSCKNASGVSAVFTSITQTLPSGTPVTVFPSSTASAGGNATRSGMSTGSGSVIASSSPTATKTSGGVNEVGVKGPWFWGYVVVVMGTWWCFV